MMADKRGQHDPSSLNAMNIMMAIRQGVPGYYRCLSCEKWFRFEDDAEGHSMQCRGPQRAAPPLTSVWGLVAEYDTDRRATGFAIWPSDMGGATYDNSSELRHLVEGQDYRFTSRMLPSRTDDEDDLPPDEPIVGEQTGPLVDADPAQVEGTAREQARKLRVRVTELREQLRDAIERQDRAEAALNKALREREAAEEMHRGWLKEYGETIEEQKREIEALRETVVAQSQEVKRLRQARVADDTGMVDVDELPGHLRTAVHKLREFIDYRPLVLKPSPPEAIHGEVTGWIEADVIGGGHQGQFAIWAYNGDVYRSPRGEIDDDAGVIIPGTRKVEA